MPKKCKLWSLPPFFGKPKNVFPPSEGGRAAGIEAMKYTHTDKTENHTQTQDARTSAKYGYC